MELPSPHVFACVIDEISSVPTHAGTRVERRRERGMSHANAVDGTLELETSDQLRELPPPVRAWLEEARAAELEAHSFALRSVERRVWIRTEEVEHRYSERFFVIPGVGVVAKPQAPPSPRRGVELDPTAPLLFTHGSAAVLMHELAGHRAESADIPLQVPDWLKVRDRPPRQLDDCGVDTAARDLSITPASSWRRWKAIDSPLRRMWDVTVEASTAAPRPDSEHCFIIRAIGAGHWNAAAEEVSLIVTDAQLLRNGIMAQATVPVRMTLRAAAIVSRIAGATGPVMRAPAVVCGSSGFDIPVGSASCDLFLGEGDV